MPAGTPRTQRAVPLLDGRARRAVTTVATREPADDELIAEFLAPYHGRTRANVTYYVRWWHQWLTTRGVRLLDAQAYDVEQWTRHLIEDRGLHTNTARSYLSGPLTLYRWCETTGRLDRDPMRHVRRPADTRRTMRPWLPGPDLQRLLTVAADMDPDTDLICHLLALNGPRVGELTRIDVRDVGHHGDLTTIRLDRRKTAASDLVSLSPPTVRALHRVLAIRPRHGPLLVSAHTGQRMSAHTVRRLLRTALAAAGLPRSARTTCAPPSSPSPDRPASPTSTSRSQPASSPSPCSCATTRWSPLSNATPPTASRRG
ncbi:tyrosine-type recombinase/integrase [Cellulomonas iranensis]|uniref:tyrosine-type recombinase/integrase n=1 Tax=Cellulomonas iranensis TaxID=76862 RepID=UPI0013D6F4C8|nr:tyrosine-type recombinase/integrase [Cellulomonas iranensis]